MKGEWKEGREGKAGREKGKKKKEVEETTKEDKEMGKRQHDQSVLSIMSQNMLFLESYQILISYSTVKWKE